MKAGSPLGRPDAHLKVLTRALLPLQFVLFVLCMLLAKTTAADEGGSAANEGGTDRLRLAVEEAIAGSSGDMGVAIKHIESGERLFVNGNRSYPMASTSKVAILVELFNQVDEGKIRLDEMVPLGPLDLHRGSGQLKRFIVPGISLSIENLAFLMMRISDNSATDMVLERVGIENVNRRLASLGITELVINRNIQQLLMDQMGFEAWDVEGLTYEELEQRLNDYRVEPGELEMAATRFEMDAQDTATPAAMNLLLEKIFLGQAASPESCRRMVDIMLKCDTGVNRIRGLLPKFVEVAHKTGTIGGTVNDVGVIYLPHGRGHIILSVLSKSCEDRDKAESAIANIARYAYDYFLFTAPNDDDGAETAGEEANSVPSVP